MGPIIDRSVVVTGDDPFADELLDGLESLGVAALHLECTFESEDAVRTAMAAADARLDGIDQVVHTWLAPGIVEPHRFVDLTDDEWAAGCEHSLAAAWWLARASAEPLRSSSGSLVFVVPTLGMAGAAEFTMLAAVAEGIRVLAKGCARQWGVDGATVNTIAAAPHHWVDNDAADALTRGISLSTPAFGGHGSAADDLAPLIALLDDPDAHFLTAATLVADGGTWVGLWSAPAPTTLLEGKTVVVTGAGGGVGRGIALACATHGANVVIAARRTETGDVVAGEIEARGGHARSIRCDVTQRADIEAAVACAVDEFGALDVMVHNALAPVGDPHPIEDVPDDTWQAMLGTAVRASYLCAQVAYPHLAANQGSLILITSAAGVEGSPYLPAYGVAKAAQRGLAKSLAREWGPAGVRVNCIGPVAMTPAMETVAETSPVFTDGLLVGRTPLRRIGDPEPDIGPVAVFLASDLARYMTGQTLMVDGGGFMAF